MSGTRPARISTLDIYLARLVAGPFAVFALILTGVVWLSQSLELLNDVIEQGQNLWIFLYLSVLIIPSILTIVLPFALFFGTLYALYRLRTDSELVVMFAAGMSRMRVARAIFSVAAIVTLTVYAINLYFLPTGMREMRSVLLDMRTQFASSLLQPGEFAMPADGLTVFVREREAGGKIGGLLVHDNRDASRPVSYIADRGQLVDTDAGPRLIMLNGNIQRRDADRETVLLYFDKYTFDLSEFGGSEEERYFKAYERYLPELLWPDRSESYDAEYADELIAEGHARLTSPLYALVFAAIAMAGLLPNQFSRRGYARRIILTLVAGVAVRVVDLAAVGWAAREPMLISIQYLLPLGSLAGAVAMIGGWDPFARFASPRAKPDTVEEAAGG